MSDNVLGCGGCDGSCRDRIADLQRRVHVLEGMVFWGVDEANEMPTKPRDGLYGNADGVFRVKDGVARRVATIESETRYYTPPTKGGE